MNPCYYRVTYGPVTGRAPHPYQVFSLFPSLNGWRVATSRPLHPSTHNSSSIHQPGCEAPATHSKGMAEGKGDLMPGRSTNTQLWLVTNTTAKHNQWSTSRSTPQSTLISHTRCSPRAVVVVTALLAGPPRCGQPAEPAPRQSAAPQAARTAPSRSTVPPASHAAPAPVGRGELCISTVYCKRHATVDCCTARPVSRAIPAAPHTDAGGGGCT